MNTLIKNPLIKDISADWLKTFSQDRKDPQWVLDLRMKAFAYFEKLEWPTKRDNKWKKYDFKKLQLEKLQFELCSRDKKEMADLKKLGNPTFTDCALEESHAAEYIWDYQHGRHHTKSKIFEQDGLVWTSLEKAMEAQADTLKEAWGNAIESSKENKFKLLNLFLGNGGLVLTVPKNKKISIPLRQQISVSGEFKALFPLNFVLVGDGSEIRLWEEMSSADTNAAGPVFLSSYTNVSLGANARMDFFELQNWNQTTIHFQFKDIFQKAFSKLNTVAVAAGSLQSRNEQNIELTESGAENEVLGVLFGSGNQQFEHWITQNHIAPKTKSDIQYRSVLQGKSESFFAGMVKIVKAAQQSDAYQSMKSLLLSLNAKAEAIPNLEIFADDVVCSHGAAVGPVDEDQKYYMQTRGIPPEMAEKMIILGFFEPVIAAVPSEAVQNQLRQFIEGKINNG